MNEELQNFGRTKLKEGLAKCNEGEQLMFKRMYAHGDIGKSIDDVVDDMEEEKISHAMTQVQSTLDKK